MQHLDPGLLKSAILLLPVVATGIAFIIHRPDYFQRVGLMLGLLLNIPWLFLLNVLAVHMEWWIYLDSANVWLGVPVEIVLGWSVFWGVFLPWVLRRCPIPFIIAIAALLDLWLMPQLTGLFVLGEQWIAGEVLLLISLLLPSIAIFKLTWKRQHILLRALIQSLIWGGWIIFMIPAVVLQVEGKSVFDIFSMDLSRVLFFMLAMAASMTPGYLAVIEFASRGAGTPIPFDPPQKLVTSGIYAYIANPLQLSTLLMLVCMMVMYKSLLMLVPVVMLILYCEIFVRWHHSLDIEKRFTIAWFDYRRHVRNWIPFPAARW